jgi:hypothetical protein
VQQRALLILLRRRRLRVVVLPAGGAGHDGVIFSIITERVRGPNGLYTKSPGRIRAMWLTGLARRMVRSRRAHVYCRWRLGA